MSESSMAGKPLKWCAEWLRHYGHAHAQGKAAKQCRDYADQKMKEK